MIKRLTTWHVRSGMSGDEALAHWETRHVALVTAVPGLRRYVQNRTVPDPAGGATPYTGLGEVWFDDADAAHAATSSPQWRAVLEDAATFMDMERIQGGVGGGGGLHALTGLARRGAVEAPARARGSMPHAANP